MTEYRHGGRGQEAKIIRIVRDLEERTEDSWDFLWGETGDTVSTMRWEEVTLWLAAMGAPFEAIQVQQRDQHSGQDIEDYLTASLTDSEGIHKAVTMFGVTRKMAVRLYMNMRLRRKQAAQSSEDVTQRSVLNTIHELVDIVQDMRTQGFGRYHGAAAVASKFASNRGVDALVRIAREGHDETSTAALWALVLLSDSSEVRPSEASREEAARRFDIRKLIVKADGANVMLEVIETRPEDACQLALHLLRALLAFPNNWIGPSGTVMSYYYQTASAALLDGALPLLLSCLDPHRDSKVRSLAVEVMRELLLSDDEDADRHAAIPLEEAFYVQPRPRSRAPTAERPLSNTRRQMHSVAGVNRSRPGSTTASQASPSRTGSSDLPPAERPRVKAREALIEAGALDVFENILVERAQVPGTLVISDLLCKGLPREDKLGDSDPYLRMFVEGKEGRTTVKEDCMAPNWDGERFEYAVADVGSAQLTIMCFDWNAYDAHKFMSLSNLHLADLAHQAVPSHRPRKSEMHISESELLHKITKGERVLPTKTGGIITLDDWVDLRLRNGNPPALRGILGSLHLKITLETDYVHDPDHLDLQAAAVNLTTLLVSHPEYRAEARHSLLAPTIALLACPSETARASAAGLLGLLGADFNLAHAIVDLGGAEALLSAASFGDASTQMRCMQAMSVLALQPTLHAALAHPTGQLAAGADIITPVLMVLQHESTPEDVFGVAVGLIANLCYQNFLFQERVMKSAIPVVVMMHMYTQRAGARAEGACMMAILADNEENRRHLAALCGHSGSDNFNMVECLSEVLCSQNSITDTRGLDGMRSCQAASASALACLSRFGGMDRLVHVLKDGESDVQILAASALAVIAQVESERDRLVATGIAVELVEMIVLARSPKARLVATQVLARVSEGGENEDPEDVERRIKKVCVFIPRFGVTAVDPIINIVLRSTDEAQRAAAAQALAAWVRCYDFVQEIWEKSSELLIDLLHVDPADSPNGLYFAVQLVFGLCEHADYKPKVAAAEISTYGVHQTVMGGLRHAVRSGDMETGLEAVITLTRLVHHGALEVMVDILVNKDSTAKVMKAIAMQVQPLCAKVAVRAKVAIAVGCSPVDLGVWMAQFMFITEEDELAEAELRGTTPG